MAEVYCVRQLRTEFASTKPSAITDQGSPGWADLLSDIERLDPSYSARPLLPGNQRKLFMF
jgi:hypothetical protein